MATGKVFIFSAPSGSGKTTIVKHLLSTNTQLTFSISATTRQPRGQEVHGKDYYFLSLDDFRGKISSDKFVEYEEVYEGVYYGTLKTEIQRIWDEGKHVVLDVDVIGGVNLKKYFGDDALAIFVQCPSIEELERRLRSRQTDSEESIKQRVGKAEEEMEYAKYFDTVLINDKLENAYAKAGELISMKISDCATI